MTKHALRMMILAASFGAMFAPIDSNGAVDLSPHDLLAQGYLQKGEGEPWEKCVYCHLPIVGGALFPPVQAPPPMDIYSDSCLVCYSCHDGTTIVSINVDASNGAFHPNSHPLRLGQLKPPIDELGKQQLTIRQEKLECVTCHSPHDNSIRAFQRVEITKLCTTCHEGLENVGYGMDNATGNHPVNETVEDDAGLSSPINMRAEFQVPFPQSYPLAGGKWDGAVHWQRGGHLSNGGEGTIECQTCHSVHGGEDYVPRTGLLAVSPNLEVADEFCEGCHQGTRGDDQSGPAAPNPGGTTTARTYHPCDDDIGNGTGRLLEIRERVAWPFGGPDENIIICTTCHVAHGGMRNTPALRTPVSAETFCEECHLEELPPAHHPIIAENEDKYKCLELPDDLQLGNPTGQTITCYGCHVAHNAGLNRKEKDFIPILRYSNREDESCLICHPEDNVTCLEEQEGTASHFLGDPTLPDTYNDTDPPLRVDDWPITGLSPRSGGDNEKKVVCLSCHVFRSSPSNPEAEPITHYLYAPAGSENEWGEDLGVYLCTGCHGERPGTHGEEGKSHPMMKANMSDIGIDPIPPATVTPQGRVNCFSCHRPHGAVPEGGYYIMNAITSENEDPKAIHPQIDFTVVCCLCHPDKE